MRDVSHEAMLREAQALVDKAFGLEPVFQKFTRTVANKIGVHKDKIRFGPVKLPFGIVNKAQYEKNGDIGQVHDILRATLAVDKPQQIEKANTLLSLMRQGKLQCISGFTPFKVKNTFDDASAHKYSVLKVNFAFQDFRAMELQLCLPCDVKALKRSHDAYIIQRACEHAIERFDTFPTQRLGLLTDESANDVLIALGKKHKKAAGQRSKHNMLAYA